MQNVSSVILGLSNPLPLLIRSGGSGLEDIHQVFGHVPLFITVHFKKAEVALTLTKLCLFMELSNNPQTFLN